jgi:hypothetical protein
MEGKRRRTMVAISGIAFAATNPFFAAIQGASWGAGFQIRWGSDRTARAFPASAFLQG